MIPGFRGHRRNLSDVRPTSGSKTQRVTEKRAARHSLDPTDQNGYRSNLSHAAYIKDKGGAPVKDNNLVATPEKK